MNVIEQADLARRWIDDPMVTMRRSELMALGIDDPMVTMRRSDLMELVQDYGDAREDMGRYRHFGVPQSGVTRAMYCERFADANDRSWRLFWKIEGRR